MIETVCSVKTFSSWR